MVTTPNSLKYLKFAGGLSDKNIRKWIESVDNTFGVVKWDKGTRFFHGDMVQSSYQLLNTLGVDKAQAEELLKPSFDYISLIRNDVEFMRYHFTDAYVREKEEKEKKVPDGLAKTFKTSNRRNRTRFSKAWKLKLDRVYLSGFFCVQKTT